MGQSGGLGDESGIEKIMVKEIGLDAVHVWLLGLHVELGSVSCW